MTNIDTDKFIITDFRSITFEQFDNFVKKEKCDTWVLDLQLLKDNKEYYEYGCIYTSHFFLGILFGEPSTIGIGLTN